MGYREALGSGSTSLDAGGEPTAVPSPPFAGSYDVTALTYAVVESFYSDGRGQFDALCDAVFYGSLAGAGAAAVSFAFGWARLLGAYRRLMAELRHDTRGADHWRFPIHEAAGYVGKQARAQRPAVPRVVDDWEMRLRRRRPPLKPKRIWPKGGDAQTLCCMCSAPPFPRILTLSGAGVGVRRVCAACLRARGHLGLPLLLGTHPGVPRPQTRHSARCVTIDTKLSCSEPPILRTVRLKPKLLALVRGEE